MNKPAPPTRWYAPWRAAAAPQDDPADLGTAFGLDLSMAPPANAGVGTPGGAGGAPGRGGWMQRWTTRRQAAASDHG